MNPQEVTSSNMKRNPATYPTYILFLSLSLALVFLFGMRYTKSALLLVVLSNLYLTLKVLRSKPNQTGYVNLMEAFTA